eukprot:10656730-Alexandrium_andersonii.AAC.1
MSASLVGSEMCIRDRFFARRSWWPRAIAQGPGQVFCLRCGGRAARAAAVSYTHLTLPTICSV